MSADSTSAADKVALVTGGAKRIGAAISRQLHDDGMRLAIHFNRSRSEADALCASLNARRPSSAAAIGADLKDIEMATRMVDDVISAHGRLDVVVNNASTFFPTPVGGVTEANWEDLVGPNLKAPFFICQRAANELARHTGCIVNIADIYAVRPLEAHPVYCVAKAGLLMLTRTLARELAPKVRVNAVAPGAILWPERGMSEEAQRRVVESTPLRRQGQADEVAKAVSFLVREARFTTGELITVDGGRLHAG